jgi:type I restriction enzyme S subunit
MLPGDILFSHINSDSHLGKAAVFNSDRQLLHGMNLLLMRFTEGVDSWFVFHYLNHLRWSGHFIGIAQHAVNQSSLNQGKVEGSPFPLCSLPEQREIVRLLDEQFTVIEQNEREIDAALKRSAALRQSILKKAFTGQLVPQDSTEEPASALLERIREERQLADHISKRKTARKKAKAI